MIDAKINVVGQGPAGLLAATILRLRGFRVSVIAKSAGSLAMWSGELSFGRNGGDDLDGWLSPDDWKAAWSSGLRALREARVPVPVEVPEKPLQTVTALGVLKPAFVAPLWQHLFTEAGSACFIGIGGVSDALPRTQARRYAATTGMSSSYRLLPSPFGWNASWGPLRFAGFFDTEEGLEWLVRSVQKEVGKVDEEYVYFPQVLGVEKVMATCERLSAIFGKPVYEFPLLAPSLGGIRIEKLLVKQLKRLGVEFYRATVASVDPGGTVTAMDGRRFVGQATILATGGVLGGGLAVDMEGSITDPITGQTVGMVKEAQDLSSAGYGKVDLRGDASLLAVGGQVGVWNPDRDHNGGAKILGTVHQAIRNLEAR